MSGTNGTSDPSPASGNGTRVAIATWAPLIASIIVLMLFGGGYLIAYATGDKNTQVLMAGAVISMATTTISFWTGGTARGGAQNDRIADQMDRQTAALAQSVPVAVVAPVVVAPVVPAPTQGPVT